MGRLLFFYRKRASDHTALQPDQVINTNPNMLQTHKFGLNDLFARRYQSLYGATFGMSVDGAAFLAFIREL